MGDNPDIDDDCGITRHEIIDYCKDWSDKTRHGCEVDCCHAECPEEDVVEIFEKLGSDEPEKNIIVVHDECNPVEQTFKNTPDDVCPGQNTVTLVHSEGGVDLPDDAPIFYGIEQNSDPNPGDFTSKVVRFYVQNPFPETTADVYVKHETSHVAGFLDSKCTEMDQVTGGCDDDVQAIEVACHEYDDKNPFALVTLYFTGTGIVVREKKWRLTNAANPRGLMLQTPLNTPSQSNVFAQRTQAESSRQKQPSVQKNQGFHSKKDSLHDQWFSNSIQQLQESNYSFATK